MPSPRHAWLALWWLQIGSLVLSMLALLTLGPVPIDRLALAGFLNVGRLAIAWGIHDRAWPAGRSHGN
jgi:hypothetical protein